MQQILFFKEFDFPLDDIRSILDHPDFDPIDALKRHREVLEKRAERIKALLNNIDNTLQHLVEGNMSQLDEEIYKGLTQEQAERYERSLREYFNDDLEKVQEVKQQMPKLISMLQLHP